MRNNKYRKVPTWLKHKPIYIVNDYDKIDGLHKNNTDVIGLSIGKAQWCDENFEPSVKVWRDSQLEDGTYRISRGSEETTFTRALDMAYFVLKIYQKYKKDINTDKDFASSVFGKLNIEEMNQDIEKDLKEYMKKNMCEIESHIELLKQEINKIKTEE